MLPQRRLDGLRQLKRVNFLIQAYLFFLHLHRMRHSRRAQLPVVLIQDALSSAAIGRNSSAMLPHGSLENNSHDIIPLQVR